MIAAFATMSTVHAQQPKPSQQSQPPAADANDRKLAESLAAFVRAFNSHDAAALAKFWKTDAVHVSKSTGARLSGRQAIQDSYTALFKEDPKCELRVTATQLRFVTSAVANIDCVADVRHTSGEVSRSELSVILVQDATGWLIDQVHEQDMPVVPATTMQLSRLQWLVGNWVDESSENRVSNETHWAGGDNYLVRTYQMSLRGVIAREGTQIISWDAEQKILRSWVFDSSGAFGEGAWQAEGDKKWVNKLVLKLPDGRRGSLTQVYELAADNKITVETIDREIDGAAQPNAPAVTLVRSGTETKSAPTSPPTTTKANSK